MQNISIKTDPQGKELVEHGSTWFPLASYDEWFTRFVREEVPWHWHDEIELVVVWEGSTLVEFMGQQTHLETGDGIFINCNELHRLTRTSEEDCHIINFVFDPEIIGGKKDNKINREYILPICNNKNLIFHKFHPSIPWEKEAISYVEKAFNLYESKVFASELLVRSNLSYFWTLLCENNPEYLMKQKSLGEDENRIKKIINYIHLHFDQKLTVKDLAIIADISESECYRLFKRMLHCTPNEYVLSHRLQLATDRLKSTNESILEISMDLGFVSPSYFTKRFKERYHITPNKFRNEK